MHGNTLPIDDLLVYDKAIFGPGSGITEVPLRSTFLLLACVLTGMAQDAPQVLKPLTDQDPKGAACGTYFRLDSGKLIYHLQGTDKTDSQPVDYVVKIVLDDKASVPSVVSKSIGGGALLTITMSPAERKAASCLPETIYVEKRQ